MKRSPEGGLFIFRPSLVAVSGRSQLFSAAAAGGARQALRWTVTLGGPKLEVKSGAAYAAPT